MAVDIAAIRTAIAERISDVCGISAYPFDVVSTVYPRAIVLPGTPLVEYHTTFGQGLSQLNFVVEVRTVATDPVPAQETLATFCGAGTGQTLSILDALEDVGTDNTPQLDGAVHAINVESVSVGPGIQLTEGPLEFTALFQVAVLARRD